MSQPVSKSYVRRGIQTSIFCPTVLNCMPWTWLRERNVRLRVDPSTNWDSYHISLCHPERPTRARKSGLSMPTPSSRTQHDHSSQFTPISTCLAPASREFCNSSEINCGKDVIIWVDRSLACVSSKKHQKASRRCFMK
jgi:hypothetical protein